MQKKSPAKLGGRLNIFFILTVPFHETQRVFPHIVSRRRMGLCGKVAQNIIKKNDERTTLSITIIFHLVLCVNYTVHFCETCTEATVF